MDEIWNARRKKLEAEVKSAVVELLAHTGSSRLEMVMGDGLHLVVKRADETIVVFPKGSYDPQDFPVKPV